MRSQGEAMRITLYKAAEELRHVLDQMDVETGELPEGFENARGLVANRAVACASYIAQAEREIEMVEAHARELLARVASQKKRHAWLRQYLLQNMASAGIEKIDGEDIKIVRYPERDVSVDIFDERQIPEEFLFPQPRKLSKETIKAALQAGADVPGAKLVWKDRLSIK